MRDARKSLHIESRASISAQSTALPKTNCLRWSEICRNVHLSLLHRRPTMPNDAWMLIPLVAVIVCVIIYIVKSVRLEKIKRANHG
jgi:hypothetical protein